MRLRVDAASRCRVGFRALGTSVASSWLRKGGRGDASQAGTRGRGRRGSIVGCSRWETREEPMVIEMSSCVEPSYRRGASHGLAHAARDVPPAESSSLVPKARESSQRTVPIGGSGWRAACYSFGDDARTFRYQGARRLRRNGEGAHRSSSRTGRCSTPASIGTPRAARRARLSGRAP
jgi:hypothetical protein